MCLLVTVQRDENRRDVLASERPRIPFGSQQAPLGAGSRSRALCRRGGLQNQSQQRSQNARAVKVQSESDELQILRVAESRGVGRKSCPLLGNQERKA